MENYSMKYVKLVITKVKQLTGKWSRVLLDVNQYLKWFIDHTIMQANKILSKQAYLLSDYCCKSLAFSERTFLVQHLSDVN